MSRQIRLFQRLVRVLFPESFRVDYESEMARTFSAQERQAREAGASGLARLWWETIVGLVRTGPREHVAQLKQDVGYAVRMMRRTPGFTAVAILTLATGIGANTAIFSVVYAVLVRPLPYDDPDTLTLLWNHWPGSERSGLSYPELLDFRERLRSVEIAGFAGSEGNLVGHGEPERLRYAAVSPNFLQVVGARLALGRAFRREEERRGEDAVVILTDDTWRRLFNGDPSVIGRTITLDREVMTIVGVLSPGFVLPHEFGTAERSALLAPLTVDVSAPRDQRGSHFLRTVARLRPDRSLAQAQAEVDAITAAWNAEYPGEYDPGYGATLWLIRTDIVGDVKPALVVLLGAVSLVLLIACANVANLLLARARVRSREIAVRKAIGASHARLVRQVLTESLVLAGVAAAAGVALAYWLTTTIVRTAPDIPRIVDVRLDPIVLAFTAVVSILTAIVFGSLPALDVARRDPSLTLSAERTSKFALKYGVRSLLVTAQVALALVLLVGAALLVKSFSRLMQVPSGINPDRVLTLRVSLPIEGYAERDRVVAFYEQLLNRLRDVPGVSAAGAIGGLPLQSTIGDWDFYMAGETPSDSGSDRAADWQVVTPGYFEAMAVPLLRGRYLSVTDRANSPAVVVINETLARTYFAGRNPIGQQIRMSSKTSHWMTIIGVSADVRHEGLDTPANAQVYLPHAQFTPFWRDTTMRSFSIAVRVASGDPLALASTVRARVRELDPTLPVAEVRTMSSVVERSVAAPRLQMLLMTAFALIALVLASVGTYGVLAYHISERTREFGVRMALGARAADILRMVIREGMTPAVAGVLIGLGGAALLTHLMTSLLFETEPLDPATFTFTAGVLLVAALLACCVPARRATRVDPSTALRSE